MEQVDLNNSGNIKIYSAETGININSNSLQSEDIEISIRDAAGRLIHTEIWSKGAGLSSRELPKSLLGATGVYLVTLRGNYTNTSERLFIR